jgi:hypothetical protein
LIRKFPFLKLGGTCRIKCLLLWAVTHSVQVTDCCLTKSHLFFSCYCVTIILGWRCFPISDCPRFNFNLLRSLGMVLNGRGEVSM